MLHECSSLVWSEPEKLQVEPVPPIWVSSSSSEVSSSKAVACSQKRLRRFYLTCNLKMQTGIQTHLGSKHPTNPWQEGNKIKHGIWKQQTGTVPQLWYGPNPLNQINGSKSSASLLGSLPQLLPQIFFFLYYGQVMHLVSARKIDHTQSWTYNLHGLYTHTAM